jgi:hypothetical protein
VFCDHLCREGLQGHAKLPQPCTYICDRHQTPPHVFILHKTLTPPSLTNITIFSHRQGHLTSTWQVLDQAHHCHWKAWSLLLFIVIIIIIIITSYFVVLAYETVLILFMVPISPFLVSLNFFLTSLLKFSGKKMSL